MCLATTTRRVGDVTSVGQHKGSKGSCADLNLGEGRGTCGESHRAGQSPTQSEEEEQVRVSRVLSQGRLCSKPPGSRRRSEIFLLDL